MLETPEQSTETTEQSLKGVRCYIRLYSTEAGSHCSRDLMYYMLACGELILGYIDWLDACPQLYSSTDHGGALAGKNINSKNCKKLDLL